MPPLQDGFSSRFGTQGGRPGLEISPLWGGFIAGSSPQDSDPRLEISSFRGWINQWLSTLLWTSLLWLSRNRRVGWSLLRTYRFACPSFFLRAVGR